MRAFKRITLCFAIILSISAPAAPKFSVQSTPGQLPKSVVPVHYAISIAPNLQSGVLKGSETIDIDARTATRSITLNALELKVTQARLLDERNGVASIQMHADDETVELTFPQPVKAGAHRLQLEFEGRINEQPQGLFFARRPADRSGRVMLASQMEPTDARRMFPCWDEPAYRATFQLTATVPQDYLAISNTPIQTETPSGAGLKTVVFGKTPKMSSYLVAFVTGDLEALSGEAAGVKLRIITPVGGRESGRYALEAVQKLLPYYEDYFGIKYPLPKLDLIAVPGGFSGAMENWGAITFEEEALLFQPGLSPQDAKRGIFVTISHEMAHQWFGNFVTMAWWNDLWLNEGFASWMEEKATDHFNPDWNMWMVANQNKNGVMESDARRTTHPIEQPVHSPAEAEQVFDDITYKKGAAFLRMLEDYVGEKVFRDGIRAYIRTHLYSNTTTDDLWNDLERASGKPVRRIASGWTEQRGFPVVKVRSTCTANGRELALEQERFRVNDSTPDASQWQIPVSIESIGSRQPATKVLLSAKSMKAVAGSCDTPVKLNADNVGYYRVEYDAPAFAELTRSIGSLSEADRLNVLDDTWALAQAGRVSAADYLQLTDALRQQNDPVMWEQLIQRLLFMDDLEIGQTGHDRFQAYARALLNPVFARVGWEPKPSESAGDARLRDRLISALGQLRDEAVINESKKRFAAFAQNREALPADIRGAVLSVVGRYADRTTFDELHRFARGGRSSDQRSEFFSAMQAAIDPTLVQENLRLALSNELPPEPAAFVVVDVAGTPENAPAALDFAKQHISELLGKLSSFTRANYIPGLYHGFSDAARANDLESYAAAHMLKADLPQAAKTAEDIRFRAAFKQRELTKIDQWVAGRR
jgi:aminopeptidase N